MLRHRRLVQALCFLNSLFTTPFPELTQLASVVSGLQGRDFGYIYMYSQQLVYKGAKGRFEEPRVRRKKDVPERRG